MTLISRALTTGARVAWIGVRNSFEDAGTGYTVENQKGQTGGLLNIFGNLISNAYESTVRNIKNNLKSLRFFFLEDLTRQFFSTSMYARLNEIEWSDTSLWEIRIDGLPKPFTYITPISQATLSAISVNLGTFTIGNTSWQYIESQGTRSLSVTIQDDVTGTMEEFLYQWMDEITGRKVGGVVPIEKAGKVIRFRKLSRGKLVTSEATMYCVPQGALNVDGNQSSRNPRTIDITFAVLGIQRSRVSQSFPFRDMSKIAAQAAANLARRNKYVQGIKSTIQGILY